MESVAHVGVVVVAVATAGCRVGFEANHDAGADIDATPGRIAVSNLTTEWATPSSVMWHWDWTGLDADLDHFEIVVGPTRAAVETRGTGSRVVGPAERPELAYPTLPGTGGDRVVHSIVDGLTPDSDVWAILVALDIVGASSATPAMTTRTQPVPTAEIVLFADTNPVGSYALPADLVESTIAPYAGTKTNRYVAPCAPDCYENLRRQDLNIALGSLPSGAFDRAFVEMWVANGSAQPSFWSDVRLFLGSCTDLYAYYPITIVNDGVYHPIQMPLHVLQNATGPLVHAGLAGGLCGWWVGGNWSPSAVVSVDEIRIRW